MEIGIEFADPVKVFQNFATLDLISGEIKSGTSLTWIRCKHNRGSC